LIKYLGVKLMLDISKELSHTHSEFVFLLVRYLFLPSQRIVKE